MITPDEIRRLARTGETVRTLTAELRAERDRRDKLVRELIERGEKYRAVARVVRLSPGTIAAIMGQG